jgi:hypothetical protein
MDERCDDWSDKRVADAIDAALTLGLSERHPGRALGHLAGARALLGILCDRRSAQAKRQVAS